MKPLSIQLYTVRDVIQDRGQDAVLKEIAAIGYKGVEGGGPNPAEFRKKVEDLGMVVSSTWGSLNTEEEVDKLIANCNTLGTKYAAGGFWIPQFETVEAIAETAEILNRALPRLKQAAIEFGLHNHWMEFELRDGRLAIDHLIERCPDVKLELDIYWCSNFGANVPVEMVRKFKDRVVLMHVKDGPQVKDEPMVAAGSGTVDVDACIHAADPAWLILELDHYAGDMMEAVRDSYTYLVGKGLAAGNRPV